MVSFTRIAVGPAAPVVVPEEARKGPKRHPPPGGVTARPDRPLRILCNTRWFEERSFARRPIESITFPPGGLLSTLRLFFFARRCDAAVFNVDERRLALFCLLARLIGRKRCRLVSVDIHLEPPRTLRARLRAAVVGWLLREVDLFICYFKATERMQRAYGLERQRFAYVPFKVNAYAKVRAAAPTDGGFALVCGQSDRDYRTLAAAAVGLDVPIVILTAPGYEQQSAVDDVAMPPNVTVERRDASSDTWIDWIARARFVILPVLPDVIKPSGISACLVAMALGKCVIITDSPATQRLIDSGQAVIVRPVDADALREAISRVANDTAYRERVAAAGRTYASALGDEARLTDDIVRCVGALIDGERAGDVGAFADRESAAASKPAP